MNCKGLVAFVTGGASGLGKATVEKLVKEGSKVLLYDLPSSKGDEVAKNLGENVKFVSGDVCSIDEVQNAFHVTKECFGQLNAIVNCAGTSVAFKTYNFQKNTAHELHDFNRVLQVNTVGTFNVIRLGAALIHENTPNADDQRGVIINTSSFSAFDGISGQVAYAASKAAVAGMTVPLARDMASAGIRVCAIAPGVCDTPLVSDLPEKVRIFLARSTIFPYRLCKPEEYALLVKHIIENPFLNGTVIRLDAGLRIM
ncbi:3-hydroxyacyl-CoA dehydrogenase type-2-like [Planococcus citri]|uniref:3-hydroxyacyl-CoA dehydrogenase type-2-like n=1 Tax=Planococcus citri TaxID=170843 RepID=UPI0031F8BA20